MVKVLFFGTPAVAVPYLNWLADHTTVAGVVCRPDEPAGRGYKVTAPPVKDLALQKKIPVFQPVGPWSDSTVHSLESLKADVGIVVAYGRIMPRPVFSAPRLGCLNIHFSLLPKYRGAAPIQWALMNGETKTGVTAFWLEEGLDSGPVADQAALSIDPEDDVTSLRNKLIPLGIQSLEKILKDVSSGKVARAPQQGEATPAPQLKKEHGAVQWSDPAEKIVNLVRGLCEWPGAATKYQLAGGPAKNLKILKASVSSGGKSSGKPGSIAAADKTGLTVQAGTDSVRLVLVQAEGKKEMPAWDFWQGAHLKIGDKLG